MKDKLHEMFVKKIKSLNIPMYTIGTIYKKDGSRWFFEVIIKRPDRYNNRELVKKVPKTYRGFKVKVL